MTRIVAKISIYDILSMIVPGSIFLMGLGMIDKICDKVQELPFVEYFGVEGHAFWTVTGTIFFLALAYTIGIIIQSVNVWIIKYIYKKLNIMYVDKFTEKIDGGTPYSHELTKGAKDTKSVKEKEKRLMQAYYQAYNCVINFNPHTAVLDLEKQIAMMRNLVIAILPGCIALMLPKCCCGVILWILIGIVLVFFIAQRMRKAVELVFEEYEAVKQLNLDK